MLDITELNDKLVSELREIAKSYGVEETETLRKQDLIGKITEQQDLILAAKNNTVATDDATPVAEAGEPAEDKPRKRTRTVKEKPEAKRPLPRRSDAYEDPRLFDQNNQPTS